ncbi:MAG TPA: hypothetical protein VGM41_14460 [Chitinophagaceae bacterium]|jgi:hypothetical protein
MRRYLFIFILLFALQSVSAVLHAQCSICTRTAQQQGERPAKALNGGILYLAATPFLIVSFIGYRWWKQNRD